MSNEQSTLAHMTEIVGALKFRASISNMTGRVRRVDETDEITVKRIFDEYETIRAWLKDLASPAERQPLDEKWPMACATLLKKMLAEDTLTNTARNANAHVDCRHCNGPCLLIPQ